MTNPVFPAPRNQVAYALLTPAQKLIAPLEINKSQDSKFYEVSLEDTSMVTKMDGGYVVSRAKHTRKPRRSFKTGFTAILNQDRVTLTTFYESVKGGSVVFDWIDPIEQVTYQVRFTSPLMFKYVGMGVAQLWDVSFSLEQA